MLYRQWGIAVCLSCKHHITPFHSKQQRMRKTRSNGQPQLVEHMRNATCKVNTEFLLHRHPDWDRAKLTQSRIHNRAAMLRHAFVACQALCKKRSYQRHKHSDEKVAENLHLIASHNAVLASARSTLPRRYYVYRALSWCTHIDRLLQRAAQGVA